MRQRVRQRKRAAKVVDDEREVLEPECIDERTEARRVCFRRIRFRARPIRQAKAEMIRCDAPKIAGKAGDEMPPLERPRGRTVREHDRVASAFVDVVEPPARHPGVARCERKRGAVDPISRDGIGGSDATRCAQDFDFRHDDLQFPAFSRADAVIIVNFS
jgi:hypothetical protein